MHKPVSSLDIDGILIGEKYPTYFIADIAANHDGDIERAKDLIYLAAAAGANAAKFQHFTAATIVSDHGFKSMGGQKSHQSSWNKSVFEVYKDATVPLDWTPILKHTCDKAGISFFTSPYDFSLVDEVDPYVPAFKIGSGDITWHQIIKHIASKNKPYIIATGASNIYEVQSAVDVGLALNQQLALLQCNTNYTANLENFKHIQLNVLKTYRSMYPEMVLGLSDHTLGHSTVLGAVTLGARIIEKHFTDDVSREGPDHGFSMSPTSWRDMVDATRELENALGSGIKSVEVNEQETCILQRRAVRASTELRVGDIVSKSNLVVLRPCPKDAISPEKIDLVLGKKIRRNIAVGDYIKWSDLE